MLQRSTQVGEFYRMAAPKVLPDGAVASNMYDIIIYDEEMDKHVHITIGEALRAAMQDLTNATDTKGNGTTTVNFFGDKAYQQLNMSEGMQFVPDGKAAAIATACKTKWMPVEVIIARPFIEHLMMSAVMAVAGRDTGATLFGPADMRTFHARSNTHCQTEALYIQPSAHALSHCFPSLPLAEISANTSVKTIEGYAHILELSHKALYPFQCSFCIC
jgi:hypothetical protein